MGVRSTLKRAWTVALILLTVACATVPPTDQPATPPPAGATLLVAKWVDKEQAVVGDVLTYTVVIINDMLGGEDPGHHVQLQDILPKALEWVPGSLSPEAAYDAASRTVRWSGAVPQGGSVAITFRAVLAPAAAELRSVLNTVAVTDAFGQVSQQSAHTQVVH